ncbi:MAG: hypothetical protein KAU14_09140 [Thermoplasmata archaeon]|nr:hypothetical protein [Thermoplasmata archaeon]
MRKGLFLMGILILLTGIMFARPDDTRDVIGKLGNDSAQEKLKENYNSTYNNAQDVLGDNMDVAGYGVAMVGIILMAMSFSRRKEKRSGLLYQNKERQQISPEQLGKKIKSPSLIISPPAASDQGKGDYLELPELTKPDLSNNQATIPNQILNPMSRNPIHDQTAGNQERLLNCPSCGEVFSMKGNINEVFCPRCGMKYYPNGVQNSG